MSDVAHTPHVINTIAGDRGHLRARLDRMARDMTALAADATELLKDNKPEQQNALYHGARCAGGVSGHATFYFDNELGDLATNLTTLADRLMHANVREILPMPTD